jgi:glycosyltransferase involved in cell wall biosynthesis
MTRDSASVVSVVVPVYNALPYLDEAIESLVGQTYPHLEIVTVDDGSDDGSAEALARWEAADSRIRVVTQAHGGFVRALRKGTETAIGAYVARLDADDFSFPERIERQVEFLDRHPDVALLGGGAVFLDESGTRFATVAYPAAHDELVRALETSCPFVHSAVIMRAEAFRAVGGYREQFPRCEDYDLWLRLSERFAVANLDEPVVGYRIHMRQTTLATLDDQARWFLIAHSAHLARRKNGRDPLDGAPERSWREWLEHFGIDEDDLTSARIDMRVWYAKTLTRARALSQARAVWADAQAIAGKLPDGGLRTDEIAEIQRAVEGERARSPRRFATGLWRRLRHAP